MNETDSIWKTPEGEKRFAQLPKWEQEKIIKAESKRERKRLRQIRLAAAAPTLSGEDSNE